MANGSTISTTPNFTSCQNSATTAVNGVRYAINIGESNLTYYGVSLALDNAFLVPYEFYTIFNDCYYGLFEGYDVALNYGQQLESNPDYLLTNFYINFGEMYANIKNIYVYFSGTPYIGSSDIY